MKLAIAKDLALPIEAVTETMAFLGRRGSGKTYAAQRLAEEMHRAHGQFVSIDPVGVWYGLRLAGDGKSQGLPVPVLGGLHGDIPLEPTGGALIANLVVDRGISVVLDVSQFESDADKARFAQAFADRFFFRKKASPSAVHVFIEECQEFVPQNPQREEARMLHAFTRMAKIGRNFGIGLSLISQRPQEVNKKVLNLAEVLFCFQLTGPQERKTVDGWIADKGIDEDIAGELPKLERGEPHVWSPAWLKISGRVQILEKTTFDASSTPKVGKTAAVRSLGSIDLEQLRTDMAATIEKAKADDPKLLRTENARLARDLVKATAELAKKPAGGASKSDLSAEYTRGREDGFEAGRLAERQNSVMIVEKLRAEVGSAFDAVDFPAITNAAPSKPPSRSAERVGRPVSPPAPSRRAEIGGAALSAPQQRILDALAWLSSIQPIDPHDRAQVALLAGASPTSSSYANNLSTLRTSGLIRYEAGSTLQLTDAGHDAARTPDAAPTTADMHRTIEDKVSNPQWRILQELIAAYPKDVDREAVARGAGASATSSSFANNLSGLRSLGFIDYRQGGRVVALPCLFIE